MKVLVVAQQKGGVGKTALSVHLAFYAAQAGLKVLVIDLDSQQNASYTLKDHKSGLQASSLFGAKALKAGALKGDRGLEVIEGDAGLADLETMNAAEAGKRFKANIASLGGEFDVCIIDTPPALGVKMAAALVAADYVLSPIEMEAYSIQGIRLMLTTIGNLKKAANPKMEFLGILASKVDRRNANHVRHEQELRDAYPQLMLPVSIGLRNSITDALATGVPVWEIKRTAARKAAKEVRDVADFVFKKMEIL